MTTYATTGIPSHQRRQLWQDVISRTYFPLEISFAAGGDFNGSLGAWSLGPVSVSRNVSDGLLYRRHERHLLNEREECYLITVPETAEIRFTQDGKEVRCRPGAFLIERSHLPYEFSHREPSALWVLKIPSAILRARISRPERLATLQFDASRGVGALFVDTLRLTSHDRTTDQHGRCRQGRAAYCRCAGAWRNHRSRRGAARKGRHLLPADRHRRRQRPHAAVAGRDLRSRDATLPVFQRKRGGHARQCDRLRSG